MFKRILVAVDDRQASEAAVAFARNVAGSFDARTVELLEVPIRSGRSPLRPRQPAGTRHRPARAAQMEADLVGHGLRSPVDVARHATGPAVCANSCCAADQHPGDGRSGAGAGAGPGGSGCVGATCGRGSAGSSMFDRVVVGVATSDTADTAVERAMDLARASGGVLHLVTGAARASARAATPARRVPLSTSSGPLDFARAAGARWKPWRAAAIPVTTHAVLADPVEALTRVAARERADLIVVGADAGHDGRHRGTVPDSLLRSADCAVLVV